MIRHDFSGIHDALNKMVIAEVKAALEKLPEKWIESHSLCRIVVSDIDNYEPKDLSVDSAWIGDDGKLYFDGHYMPVPDNEYEEPETYEGSEEDTDMLDITDFGYLIEQIANTVEGDATYNLPNASVLTCGYVAELSLKQAIEKTVTV